MASLLWRGPAAAGPQLSYRQPLALLQLAELKELLLLHKVSSEGCHTADDFRLQALKHDLDGLDLFGAQAIEAKAREMSVPTPNAARVGASQGRNRLGSRCCRGWTGRLRSGRTRSWVCC
jgi:hypothetical protein